MPPLKTSSRGDEEIFSAEQNARLVVNAERYYRSMYRGREWTWNLRDRHMVDTLDALRERIAGALDGTVVWAHNSHVGDARATEMSRRRRGRPGSDESADRFVARIFRTAFQSVALRLLALTRSLITR
jgi:erythromycin esterase-like protein